MRDWNDDIDYLVQLGTLVHTDARTHVCVYVCVCVCVFVYWGGRDRVGPSLPWTLSTVPPPFPSHP